MHNGDELRSVKKAVVDQKSKLVHWCEIPLLAAIIGTLGRKHVKADSVVYIGKESNNIDEQVLEKSGNH